MTWGEIAGSEFLTTRTKGKVAKLAGTGLLARFIPFQVQNAYCKTGQISVVFISGREEDFSSGRGLFGRWRGVFLMSAQELSAAT